MRRALSSALLALAACALPSAASAQVRVATFKEPDVTVDLYGWAQPRFTYQEQDTRPIINFKPNPAFTVQRARLGAIGTLGSWAKFQVEFDLSRETAAPIDAFAIFTPYKSRKIGFDIQLGQFRVPISRQNLIQSRQTQFADLAYFVRPRYIIDRDIGAQLTVDILEGRVKLMAGIFNGNDPGRGQVLNTDPYFLYAGRLQVEPLGAAPRFEGDTRPVAERKKPLFTIAGSAIRNRSEDKHFLRSYVGADAGLWWQGASVYGEFYYHVDDPLETTGANATTRVKQMGWNVQAGYFIPAPWVREHLEIAARVQYIDPNIGVKQPANDNGARDLDQSNPTWGYMGYVFGANLFVDRGHHLKLQTSYEIRNETKRCLEGQSGDACTGFIKNNVFLVQATAGF